MRRICRRQGFSLIEISVVILIIAVLVGAGVSISKNALATAKRIQTQERLQIIKNALENYARLNDHLPCPMSRALTPTANPTTFGLDPRPGATCTASAPGLKSVTGSAGILMIGGVPVRSLGLPDAYAADAWGNKFTYAVSASAASTYSSALTNYSTAIPTIKVSTGVFGSDYAVSAVTDRTVVPSTAAAITAGNGALYVVASMGPDGRGAWGLNDTTIGAIACDTSNASRENCNDDELFWSMAYNDSGLDATRYFDDYIVWGSNALNRPIINTAATTCTTGCEAWCAPCSVNLPSGAPANMVSGTAVLCKKLITSSSSTSPCTASCVWAGTITATSKKVLCP